MDAILIAGGIPLPEDPLYPYTEGRSKAMLDMAGKPMVQWVLDALTDAKKVDNVILIGLSPKSNVNCSKSLHYLPSQGRMLENIVAGVEKSVELDPKSEHVLIVSADIPGLTGEMLDWMVEKVEEAPADLCYGVITREVIENRYPNSRRTWTHLKDMDVCGADVGAIHVDMVSEHLEMWDTLIGNRKSPLKQAAAIGFGTMVLLLFRQLTFDEAVKRVCERIGIEGRGIVCPWAELGMDVDKPHQLELLREDLSKKKRNA